MEESNWIDAGLLILGAVFASAAPKGKNSAGLQYVDMYQAEEGKWAYVFRVGSVAESTASWGEPLPLIHTTGVRVEEVAGNNYFAIFSAPYDSEYAGAWPLSGIHDYSTFKRVAGDIMNLVVSQMNQKLGTALSVIQLLKDLYVDSHASA